MTTLAELLADAPAGAPAIAAPDRAPLTYAGLRALVQATGGALRGLGVGRGDAVALVLPNGPEAATTFVAVASHAVAAPLNPAYRAPEFRFYLEDLGARLLLVPEGFETPAVEVAAGLGIPVARLLAAPGGPAGQFVLDGPGGTLDGDPADDDVALVLHTSGTTSRPKIVPLTHANLCASAHNIAASLALGQSDRCLNVMPLFHIHGLVAAVLASLAAGSEVVCTPGFDALRFFGWLRDARPSWYTAVPTMHQAILARAPRNADVLAGARLRFVRSSSASLPPPVMAELESCFDAPVIEAYGMTEAAHQMASNPLPPGARKAGSVGPAAGPEVAVMDEGGRLLGPGETGEVVIRGPNVTPGYRANAAANAEAFVDGWFRTGDQGHLDEDGYLWLSGRLKEIINRGGEKISPREVDDVLIAHPAVAQVVTFAVPHPRLGEDVAAAVVLAEGVTADAAELRAFAGERLAAMKVPAKIVFLDEIPRGATGKLQRIGLAERLGLADEP